MEDQFCCGNTLKNFTVGWFPCMKSWMRWLYHLRFSVFRSWHRSWLQCFKKNCLSTRLLHELSANHFRFRQVEGTMKRHWWWRWRLLGRCTKMKRKICLHLRWCRPKSKPTEQLNCCDPNWYWHWREAAWQKPIHILLKRWKESRTELRLHPASCLNSSRTWQASDLPTFLFLLYCVFPKCMFLYFLVGVNQNKRKPPIEKETHLPNYPMEHVSFWEGYFTNFWYP